MSRRQVTVLGATGSIGASTLDVLSRHHSDYAVFALTAQTRVEDLLALCRRFEPRYAVIGSETAAERLSQGLQQAGISSEVLVGPEGLALVASHAEVDIVMAAIVGAAGLRPSLAAASAGKKLLLANKESLVMAGQLFMDAVEQGGACLLPIDSEHNAIYQCLPDGTTAGRRAEGIERILLTASGGPLRGMSAAQLAGVTPAEACAHPNWSMGQKISVDSATLMNKGLELIEACWLFGVDASDIEVVVHPQSIIHSMVSYIDGSVVAQMGNPDMRTPIAYGLAWPQRIDAGVSPLDLVTAGQLDFEAPDDEAFPGLLLARQAWQLGGTASAILNAANEETVAAFLGSKISLPEIFSINQAVLDQQEVVVADTLLVVERADSQARDMAQALVSQSTFGSN